MMQQVSHQSCLPTSARLEGDALPGTTGLQRWLVLALALTLVLLFDGVAHSQAGLVLRPPAEAGATWQAGFAAVEVTPPEGTILGGYVDRPRRVADGVESPLYARAVVLADASGTSVVLISVDAFGLFLDDIEFIRRRVGQRLTIEDHQIILTATGTHTGPDALGAWGGWNADARRAMRDGAAEAALAAIDNVAPARLSWQPLDLTDLIRPMRDDSPAVTSGLVLRAQVPDGQHRGMLVHIPARPDTMGPEATAISPDYPGHLAKNVEQHFGGTAVVVPGLTGDQQPAVAERGDGAPAAFAAELLEHITANGDAWIEIPADETLSFQHHRVELPVTNWRLHAMAQLRRVNRHGSHGRLRPRMVAFRMGELNWVTVPGEGFAALHEAWTAGDRIVVPIGPANDYVGTLVPPEQYERGGTEERYLISRQAHMLVQAAGEGLLQQMERMAEGLQARPEQVFEAMDDIMYIVPSRSVRLADEGVYSRAASTQRRVLAAFYIVLIGGVVGVVLGLRRVIGPKKRPPRRRRRSGGKVVQGPRPVRRDERED